MQGKQREEVEKREVEKRGSTVEEKSRRRREKERGAGRKRSHTCTGCLFSALMSKMRMTRPPVYSMPSLRIATDQHQVGRGIVIISRLTAVSPNSQTPSAVGEAEMFQIFTVRSLLHVASLLPVGSAAMLRTA